MFISRISRIFTAPWIEGVGDIFFILHLHALLYAFLEATFRKFAVDVMTTDYLRESKTKRLEMVF